MAGRRRRRGLAAARVVRPFDWTVVAGSSRNYRRNARDARALTSVGQRRTTAAAAAGAETLTADNTPRRRPAPGCSDNKTVYRTRRRCLAAAAGWSSEETPVRQSWIGSAARVERSTHPQRTAVAAAVAVAGGMRTCLAGTGTDPHTTRCRRSRDAVETTTTMTMKAQPPRRARSPCFRVSPLGDAVAYPRMYSTPVACRPLSIVESAFAVSPRWSSPLAAPPVAGGRD